MTITELYKPFIVMHVI